MQYVKTKSNQNISTRVIVLTALFAALTTVLTMTVKIPTITGYVHAGDSMIYLGACILPGPFGIIAGAIGGGLADLLSGYPHWIIPSIIIKSLNALPFVIACYIQKKRNKNDRITNPLTFAAIVPASLVTIFGYFFAHVIMKGWPAGFAGLPNECVQAVAAAIIFAALGFGLDGMKFKTKVLK